MGKAPALVSNWNYLLETFAGTQVRASDAPLVPGRVGRAYCRRTRALPVGRCKVFVGTAQRSVDRVRPNAILVRVTGEGKGKRKKEKIAFVIARPARSLKG